MKKAVLMKRLHIDRNRLGVIQDSRLCVCVCVQRVQRGSLDRRIDLRVLIRLSSPSYAGWRDGGRRNRGEYICLSGLLVYRGENAVSCSEDAS